MKYIGVILTIVAALFLIIGMVYSHMGLWFIALFFIPILWFAGRIIWERRKPLEEREEYQIEEKQKARREGLQRDQRWFEYINGTTCISCGKTKPKGAQLCDLCCPICGKKKTKQALICKNCLKDVPREDMLNLSQGTGGLTKREIRTAISRANVPIRIEKMLDAAMRGEELKYGPELGVDLSAEQATQEQKQEDESEDKASDETAQTEEEEARVWGGDHEPEYW